MFRYSIGEMSKEVTLNYIQLTCSHEIEEGTKIIQFPSYCVQIAWNDNFDSGVIYFCFI